MSEENGWRTMDSAPRDGSRIIAIVFYATSGWGEPRSYAYEGPPNFWISTDKSTCIRPDYQDRARWIPSPPLPAPPQEGR